MKKKFLSMVLACAMVASFGLAVSADTISANNGEGQVALDGNITFNPELISVAMPANINFEVGLTQTAEGEQGKFDKVISGTGTITNNSNIDINVKLTNVVDDQAFPVLGSKMNLFLEKASVTETAGLTALANGPADRTLDKVNKNGGQLSLKVLGAAATGDPVILTDPTAEQKFSVTLTLKVEKAAAPAA